MTTDIERIRGVVVAELWRAGDAAPWLRIEGRNLVTQYGDQYYGDRAAAIGSIDAVTGMRLGTGSTAAAKTGAGAAIVTYLSASQKALAGSYPQSSLESGARRITYQCVWAPGEATSSTIREVVLTNEDPLTNVAGVAGDTVSRFVFPSNIDKQAADTLTVTWHHDLLGA